MAYSRGSGKNCAIVSCRNNYRKLSLWKKSICDIHSCRKEDCACLLPFRLHSFPRDRDKRQQWTKAVNRKDFEPKVYSTVCSIHFVDGRPTKRNPVPQLNLGYESKVEEWKKCMETDDGDVVFQSKATGCYLPVKETIKLSTCTKSMHIEHPYYVPSINMGCSRESDQGIDEMNSNKVQPIKGNSNKHKRKKEKVTSFESMPLMLMVSSHVKNSKSIILPVKSEILEQLESAVLPSCSNPNFQMFVCSRPTVEISDSNINNMCIENQNLGTVAHENNSGLIYNIKQEPVDDYYNESQDSTQNSVVNNDSQTSSFSPISYDNVNSNDHRRKMKEVDSSSILNKTHVNQEKQSSRPMMMFRNAKNMQKTIISGSMGGNSSHNMGDNSSHNTGGNSTMTNYLFSDQVKVPQLQTKDSGTDSLNGKQSLEPQLDNTKWRNSCVNFLKDSLQNTINRLEDLGVDVAAWVLIPNNDKSSLIHQMGSQKGREFVESKPDINTELHLFLQNYQKKDNGEKNNSKEISKKKLEEDSCSVESMETSSCDGEPPENISENKDIPCSILNDCKPTNVLFSVKALEDNNSCIVVRQEEDSSKEELQVNTPRRASPRQNVKQNFTSSFSKEKIQLKRKISSVDTDLLSDDEKLSELSKEEKAALVKTCKDIFTDKKVALNTNNHQPV